MLYGYKRAKFTVIFNEGEYFVKNIIYTLGQHFTLGLQVRYSKAEVTLFGVEGEAGGTTAGFMLGYHWQMLKKGPVDSTLWLLFYSHANGVSLSRLRLLQSPGSRVPG